MNRSFWLKTHLDFAAVVTRSEGRNSRPSYCATHRFPATASVERSRSLRKYSATWTSMSSFQSCVEVKEGGGDALCGCYNDAVWVCAPHVCPDPSTVQDMQRSPAGLTHLHCNATCVQTSWQHSMLSSVYLVSLHVNRVSTAVDTLVCRIFLARSFLNYCGFPPTEWYLNGQSVCLRLPVNQFCKWVRRTHHVMVLINAAVSDHMTLWSCGCSITTTCISWLRPSPFSYEFTPVGL